MKQTLLLVLLGMAVGVMEGCGQSAQDKAAQPEQLLGTQMKQIPLVQDQNAPRTHAAVTPNITQPYKDVPPLPAK